MTTIFDRLGTFITKKSWLVVIVMVVLFLLAGFSGSGLTKRLASGGFEDPNSDSYKATQLLHDSFNQKPSNLLLLITAKDGTVDSQATAAAGLAVESQLRGTQYLDSVYSYWTTQATALKSQDGKQALIIGTIEGTDDQVAERIKTIQADFTEENAAISVGVGGAAEINRQFRVQVDKDLKVAESVAFPVTLIFLLFVFRSVVAALLPIMVGMFAIIGSFFVLFLITKVTDVSIYALNLTTMLGLGLAIDYSLFIVSRFREQLATGASVKQAVEQTMSTAGRTVIFSALTVAVSLSALLVFPQFFLRSFAFAGLAVSLVAALGSLLLLPAVLNLLGKRVNALALSRKAVQESSSKFWGRIATFVMHRPWPVALAVTVLLLVLGYPFLSINLGSVDERGLPAGTLVREVHQQIRDNFSSKESSAVPIVSRGVAQPTDVDTYARALSKLENVNRVEAGTGIYVKGERLFDTPKQLLNDKGSILSVVPNVEAVSTAGEELITAIRAVQAPFPLYVGGQAANLLDTKASIIDHLPLALGLIALATFVLLFLMFGSLLVPVKALVINTLSLAATFGIMVWIFQEGHLSSLLHFTATGMIDSSQPILMFCIAFGLSMDYEVFLLSRIKEYYDKTGNNREAVAHGLEKTGGIVSAAAVSISVIFFAFATSGIIIIKMLGLGLAVAVLLDAFVIRGTLVPAFMRLAGDANWWLPKSLKKIYQKLRIVEG